MFEIETNRSLYRHSNAVRRFTTFTVFILVTILFYACSASAGGENAPSTPLPVLPVIALKSQPAITYQEFSASLEGRRDIEIRPQVEGYLEQIYVDEGARVTKGQPLFRINERPFRESLNMARANLAAAQASLTNARIQVTRLAPLVESGVVADVQLKSAQAAYDAASASVVQARAQVQSASISLGYCLIKAPADGYIARIPYKTGSLVGTNSPNPLTLLSENKEIFAYFSLSEADFLQFSRQYAGASLEDKIRQLPLVELRLADGSTYPQKGRVETVSGQFDQTMGAISFRARFQNSDGLLRSGITGNVRLPRPVTGSIILPQEATFELQDKIMVFALTDSNKVISKPVAPVGRSGNYYLVSDGLKEGEKIVFAGFDRLQDGSVVQPRYLSMDSLLKQHPL